jgi:hypothetical protein
LLQLIERHSLVAGRCRPVVVQKVQVAPNLGPLNLISQVAESHAQQRRQRHQQRDASAARRAYQAERPAPNAIHAHSGNYPTRSEATAHLGAFTHGGIFL